jgi:uncharacterized protein YcbX
MDELGRVEAIYRYPVKSMGGERLAAATLRWPGIDGDRQYAFYRAADASRFPWLTGREVSELVTYAAHYAEPDNPRHSAVRVNHRDREYDVGDPELREALSREAGEEVRLLQVGRGTFDAMPVSVLSTATLSLLEARCGHRIDVRRFRANIVVEANARVRETDWLGGTIVFGDHPRAARLRVNVAIDRCVMITIDPENARRDPGLLRRVVEDFANEIGVRCTTEAVGTISVGDRVHLVR